jgi:hypothetical protein
MSPSSKIIMVIIVIALMIIATFVKLVQSLIVTFNVDHS